MFSMFSSTPLPSIASAESQRFEWYVAGKKVKIGKEKHLESESSDISNANAKQIDSQKLGDHARTPIADNATIV